MAEQRFVEPPVEGSSPSGHPNSLFEIRHVAPLSPSDARLALMVGDVVDRAGRRDTDRRVCRDADTLGRRGTDTGRRGRRDADRLGRRDTDRLGRRDAETDPRSGARDTDTSALSCHISLWWALGQVIDRGAPDQDVVGSDSEHGQARSVLSSGRRLRHSLPPGRSDQPALSLRPTSRA